MSKLICLSKAAYRGVRLLAPILDRPVSLATYDSVNAQAPYLLRSVLPKGLPNPRDLFISQIHRIFCGLVQDHMKGPTWYEDEDGEMHENDTAGSHIDIFHNRDQYFYSIV
ncbi:hypothetical protein CVT25_007616 [Psilocybe cyanescens]|uniref:Uncharacterized protein n=1 Tax=Psilocybe cyanescens TaxID=93625 RepID=A0A409X192_PSICY|nr:hypothetical protein CVT25_007616 [Psilocybe cyanescens]